jgi:hypothetical protein
MPFAATAIHDVMTGVVSVLDSALAYPVSDGPPTTLPDRSEFKFVAIGAEAPLETSEDAPPVNSATMDQVWKGLGAKSREEEMNINCVAVGKSTTIAEARGLATAVVNDVASNLGLHPGTLDTWNALVSNVTDTRSRNVPGGAVVQMQFVITVRANLYQS